MAENHSEKGSRRDLRHLDALNSVRRQLEVRIAEVERFSARHDSSGVLANLDAHLVRLIATELAESATTVNREWELAALSERVGDLDTAMAHLANAYVQVNSLMPNQIEDVGNAIWEAMADLEARLDESGDDLDGARAT